MEFIRTGSDIRVEDRGEGMLESGSEVRGYVMEVFKKGSEKGAVDVTKMGILMEEIRVRSTSLGCRALSLLTLADFKEVSIEVGKVLQLAVDCNNQDEGWPSSKGEERI